MDTGGTKVLVDLESARAMGLLERMAKGSEFGTFYGLGSVKQAYARIAAMQVPVHFSADMVLYICEL